jgi:hypothetical protein
MLENLFTAEPQGDRTSGPDSCWSTHARQGKYYGISEYSEIAINTYRYLKMSSISGQFAQHLFRFPACDIGNYRFGTGTTDATIDGCVTLLLRAETLDRLLPLVLGLAVILTAKVLRDTRVP